MFSRARNPGEGSSYGGTSQLSTSDVHSQGPAKLRRAKSMSSTVTQRVQRPTLTRSDTLTEQERHNQARAAAARAFKNDLLRRSGSGTVAYGTLPRQPSVHFEHSARLPTSDHSPYSHIKRYEPPQGDENVDNELIPHQFYHQPCLSTAPSSYRRLRRSRSLFSVTHKHNNTTITGTPERSNTVSGNGLQPRRSMSFLRGGTEFMPSTYRKNHQLAGRERKPLTSTGTSSLRGGKVTETESAPFAKPRSLRMKVRQMSSSIKNSFKRALFFTSGREVEAAGMPPQHVPSNRPYFREYDINTFTLDKSLENSPHDIAVSRVNSGAPTLRRVPSSIGYPSRSGSIRIVTPPKMVGTPLSSCANTWASSTTVSTMRSATSSTRLGLSIIRETTPKDESEGSKDTKGLPRPRNKALDAQRVYSAFLRVTRAKAAEPLTACEGEKQPLSILGEANSNLLRDSSIQSSSSLASTVRKKVSSLNGSVEESYPETPRPSPSRMVAKENIPPTQLAVEPSPMRGTRTHVVVGPRITLYPPPETVTTPNKEEKIKDQGEMTRSIRHAQSAFFPYTGGYGMVGASPSPYKRATAMSPDAPSIYSRTTSGNTPRAELSLSESPFIQQTSSTGFREHQNQFVRLGRKVSLVQIRDVTSQKIVTPDPSPSKTSFTSYTTARTRRDENLPFTTYLSGLRRPGEDTSQAEEAPPSSPPITGAFRMSFLGKGRGRRDVALGLVTKNSNGIGEENSEQRTRILKAKKNQETGSDPSRETQPLAGIDSNVDKDLNKGDRRGSWGFPARLRNPNRSQVPTEMIDNPKKGLYPPNNGPTSVSEDTITPVSRSVFGEQANMRKLGDLSTNPLKGSSNIVGTEKNIMGQMPKFSFEVNDDKGYTLSINQPRPSMEPNMGNQRILLRKERRNASVESGIGAFL